MTNAPDAPFDALAFRTALGQFATGVTIVTTRDKAGNPVGMTASSFNSVSLEPPLVLWSIDRAANCFDLFLTTDHFAIHVLGADQVELSNRFGRPGPENKFFDIETHNGRLDSPILPYYNACFECALEHRYQGGDHVILVGRVLAFDSRGGRPLLFHGGAYGQLDTKP